MAIRPTQGYVVYNAEVSGTTPVYSNIFTPGDIAMSIQLETTGTLSGTATLWASDDPDASLIDDDQWVDITSSGDGWAVANPAGSAVSSIDSLLNVRFAKMRVKYANASGTGNLKICVGL